MGAVEGRVALVTGASRGIGRAIAVRLAAEGAAVALVDVVAHEGDSAVPGSLASTAKTIEALGGRAALLEADLSRPDGGREGLLARAEAELGAGVDILVNNAGMAIYQPFEAPDFADIRKVFEVNFFSPWDLCRQAIGGMRARGAGWIVNIGSFAAVHPSGPPFMDTNPGMRGSVYGTSKAALQRLTTAIAAEAYADGIAANVLAPNASVKVRDDWPYPDEITEPVDTMAEAALALATCSPDQRTGKINYSLSLIVELGREVRTVDATALLPGWQPSEISPSRLRQP